MFKFDLTDNVAVHYHRYQRALRNMFERKGQSSTAWTIKNASDGFHGVGNQ